MRTNVAFMRKCDGIVEAGIALHNQVMVRRVKSAEVARVRQTLAAMDQIRGNAVRTGLLELALAPALSC